MKLRLCVLLLFLASLPGAHGRVVLLSPDSMACPNEPISTLSIRCAMPKAKPSSLKLHSWTLSWPGVEIKMEWDFRHHQDGIDEPKAKLTINGREPIELDKADTSGGYNTLTLRWNRFNNKCEVSAGSRRLEPLAIIEGLPQPRGETLKLEGTAKIEFSRMALQTDENSFERLVTHYASEDLDSVAKWKYIDRSSDPKVARVGGDYLFALMPDGEGIYNIVYLGGATINPAQWKPGMLKGRLIHKGFKGYYALEWVDSTGCNLADESYAMIDEGLGVITLHFPGLDASIRLKRL